MSWVVVVGWWWLGGGGWVVVVECIEFGKCHLKSKCMLVWTSLSSRMGALIEKV